MRVSIQPYTVVANPALVGGVATQLYISDNFTGVASHTVVWNWRMLDADGAIILFGTCALTGQQYTDWGSEADSTYIPGCVALNLGVTLA